MSFFYESQKNHELSSNPQFDNNMMFYINFTYFQN